MNILLPDVEKRLQDRYQKLVQEHAGHSHPVAAGPRLLPDEPSTHAAAMAAWRFYANPHTTFTGLAQSLLQIAQAAAPQPCLNFALVPLDWSKLDFRDHASKTDRVQIGRRQEWGYQLLSALLRSDVDGQPLAPRCAQLRTAAGLLSSRFERPRPPRSVLDELAPVMDFVQGLPRGPRPVFMIDAEADSVYHYRQWQRRGFLFLVRADKERYVTWQGQEWTLPAMRQRLAADGRFVQSRFVEYEGRLVGQYVAEAAVQLTRPGVLKRWVNGRQKRWKKPGPPLAVRLIVSELRDEAGQVLERWYLLTNVPVMIDTATLALWYFWRWRIETFFKLLKDAGQQIEHWQQANGRFLLKRLLVASMACVLAWRLAHRQAPQAEEIRQWIMRLSGRHVAYGKPYTLEGLLAGTWVLLAATAILKEVPAHRLQEMADFVLNGSDEVRPTLRLLSCESDTGPPLREAG